MPTGYTADVQSGKVTEFRDFALQCARNFGALIELRDEPHDAPVPDELKPHTTYHDERIQESQTILAEVAALSDEECMSRADAAHADALDRHRQYARDRNDHRLRYEAMLAKVRAWQPPSSEHLGMKDFMIEQLSSSLDFDCREYKHQQVDPERLTGQAWKAATLDAATTDLAYHTKKRDEEIARTADRNRWLADLRASLDRT